MLDKQVFVKNNKITNLMTKILFILKKFLPKKLFKKLQPIYHCSLAWIAAFIYRHPSEKLIVIGVTGTTGKTTIIHLIAKVLEEAGFKVGYTSTAMFKVGEKEWNNDKKMTMIGRFFTQKLLRNMWRQNCQYAIIETTSQGIEQFRHRFINYDVLLFTGLYPEHIEAHGGFDNYKKAKLELFAHLKRCRIKYVDDKKTVLKIKNEIKKIHSNRVSKTIIVNGDSEYAADFLNFKSEKKYQYQTITTNGSKKNEAVEALTAEEINIDSQGVSFTLDSTRFNLKLMGLFNVSNALAAATVGVAQGIDLKVIKRALEKVDGVPGRFEKINQGQDFDIIVDYAFEPNAVAKLYETINYIKKTRDNIDKIKVIHVLGSAGGGRDVARRPILGRMAGEMADVVIVTNEDPYDDDPQIIIDQICLGVEKAGKILNQNLFNILDRRDAIKKALQMAKKGDIVLITGKGNEQAIASAGGVMLPWDDRQVVRALISELKLKV